MEKATTHTQYSHTFEGSTVETSIVMEPGEQYGNKLGDFFSVGIKGIGAYYEPDERNLIFSSFEQLEEFARQLNAYIAEEEKRITAKNS